MCLSNIFSPPPVSNRFCDDWIQAFLNAAERCNPFLLRQILENFKLKVREHARGLQQGQGFFFLACLTGVILFSGFRMFMTLLVCQFCQYDCKIFI